jgi:hypothetical protein
MKAKLDLLRFSVAADVAARLAFCPAKPARHIEASPVH